MRHFQGLLPILLSVLFLGSISGLTYRRAQELQGSSLFIPTLVFVGLYLLWIVLESKVATKEIGQEKTQIDSFSLELYAFSRALVVLSGLYFAPHFLELHPLHYAGLSLFMVAIVFRLVAIRQLGQFYSHRVRVQSEHKIISQGPYRFVRHPAYTGMILSHLGFSLFFFNTWTLGFWALIHVPAVVYRILVEEKALFQIKGYPEYARNRKRIIPLLW
ncbi:MAG: isoprenylcysteine carboxylmethyltransferase family protein [Proteobacteria bacterium]|nr:isoprenylcysteine carboxylmethyltransferase family protein [Pseudomonadota bacterium]